MSSRYGLWLLVALALVTLTVGACDDTAEERNGVVLTDATDANNSDTPADAGATADTASGSDTQLVGDTGVGGPDTAGAPDSMVDATTPDTTVECIDCECVCADGVSIPYGGCFGPGDEIPVEIANCSADCPSVCGVECPDIDCFGVWCPAGQWVGAEGCSTCACAPPPTRMAINEENRNATHVTFETNASMFIGALDRYILEFSWFYDHPDWDDEEEIIDATIRLVIMDWQPGPEMQTFYWPSEGNSPLEIFPVTHTQWGAQMTHDMNVDRGMVTIMRVGDRLVGGVHLTLTPATTDGWPAQAVVAGSFDVPLPQ